MSYLPPFVSEFPDHPVTDCVPASGLMLANKVSLGAFPSGVTEREALQNAMGTQDQGADAQQLAAGVNARYQLGLVPGNGWAGIELRLSDPARGAAIFGTYQLLPGDIRAHGGQPAFTGGHCMYAQNDGPGTVTLGDPLASSYLPGVPIGELSAFCAGLGDQFLAGTERPHLVGYRAVVGPGLVTFWQVMRFTHTLYSPRANRFARTSPAPVNKGAPGFWRVSAGGYAGRYLVHGRSGPFTILAVYSDGSQLVTEQAA